MDAFGQTASGRITFRRVVNARVQVSKTTHGPVDWRPISWGLVSSNGWPGHETTRQVVTPTDGKLRLVQTHWETGKSLRVRVIKVVGEGFPRRLVVFDDVHLYWVAADRLLHRATWTRKGFRRPVTLPLAIRGATAITLRRIDRGMRIYCTDRAGELHFVADDLGASPTDIVLRSSGYRTVTGLRAGVGMSPNYVRVRPYSGLLSVDRATGIARYQRALRSASAGGGTVTRLVRVRPSDWTWRRLGSVRTTVADAGATPDIVLGAPR
jgi:hypothetical protein